MLATYVLHNIKSLKCLLMPVYTAYLFTLIYINWCSCYKRYLTLVSFLNTSSVFNEIHSYHISHTGCTCSLRTTFSTGLLWGNKPATGALHHEGPVMRSFDVFVASPNKLLNKQLSYRGFEAPWHSCEIAAMTNIFIVHIDVSLWFGRFILK